MDKVKECIYPRRNSCRGCSHSINSALYDGGCNLHYAGQGEGESLQAVERETVAQPCVNFRKIQRGSAEI